MAKQLWDRKWGAIRNVSRNTSGTQKKKKPFFLELTVGKNDVVVGDMRGHV